MFKYYFRTIKFLNICNKCQYGPQWDRWCCLELLTSSLVVRVLLDGAVHIICVIYLLFMDFILYLLLHSRKGLSTVVQGIFWKFPWIFNSHFLCIFTYYKCSISERSLHASQYTLPICLQGFQNKGFWLYANQVMHCRHLIIWTLANSHCLLQGSKQVVIRSQDWNTGWMVKKCPVPYLKDDCCMGSGLGSCIVM
jgi:hypothetical protein